MSLASSAARALAALGDGVDGAGRGSAQVAGALGTVARQATGVWLATGAVALVAYLAAIGDLAVSAGGRWAGVDGVRATGGTEASQGIFDTKAPYLFEPVLALHPGAHVAVFVSPVNIALGALLAALIGANVAVALHARRTALSCPIPGSRVSGSRVSGSRPAGSWAAGPRAAGSRVKGYSGVAGAMPAFLLGFACCAPAVLLAMGTGAAALLVPVITPLRPVFYPLAVVLLLASLGLSVRRLRSAHRQADPEQAGPEQTEPAQASEPAR